MGPTDPTGSAKGSALGEAIDRSVSERLHGMATGYRLTQTMYAVAKLGVADLLADGPKDADALAAKLGVQPRALFRVMRFLASQGLFTQDASDRFGLTPLGEPLRTDHPQSMRYSAIMHGELHYRAAGEILHTVRTGETGFRLGKVTKTGGMLDLIEAEPV